MASLRSTLRRALLAATLMVSVTAIAQPEQAAPPRAPAASIGEMRTRSVEVTAQLKGDYQHVTRLREIATKKADVIKRNCVNDKLVQLKPLMNIADTAAQNLESETDPAAAASLYKQVNEAGTEGQQLREEANGCMGELELYRQEAGVDVVRPDVLDDPGTIDPMSGEDLIVDVEPPGYASPFN